MSDGDRLPPAADVVEEALSVARGHGCVVVVSDGSEADVDVYKRQPPDDR